VREEEIMTRTIIANGQWISSGQTYHVPDGRYAQNCVIEKGGRIVVDWNGETRTTRVESGGELTILAGGLDSNATIYGHETVSGGGAVAISATVNGGGIQSVAFGAVASSTIVNGGGLQFIDTGGLGSGGTIQSGGRQVIQGAGSGTTGGIASATIVGSGGVQYVSAGGIANATTVSLYGQEEIYSGGIANATTLSGTQDLFSGGVVSGTIVKNGGVQWVSGGLASATVVAWGGSQIIVGGRTIGTTVSTGGYEEIDGGLTSATTLAGGYEIVFGGTTSNTAVFSGGLQDVGSGWGNATAGTANATLVYFGGTQEVFAGGKASGTVINSAGLETVCSGGVSHAAIIDGGIERVSSGGVTDATTIEGGRLELLAGSIATNGIDFAHVTGGSLWIYGTVMPTTVISGLVVGDAIDLRNVANVGALSLLPHNTLAIFANNTTYQLSLDPNWSFPNNASINFTADGAGGTLLTVVALAGASPKSGSAIAGATDPKAGGIPSTDLLTQHMATSFASPGPVTSDAVGGGLASRSADAAPGLAPPQRGSHVLM
jgi:autotransporter passenger strand-loop-strand repeat protein